MIGAVPAGIGTAGTGTVGISATTHKHRWVIFNEHLKLLDMGSFVALEDGSLEVFECNSTHLCHGELTHIAALVRDELLDSGRCSL